MNKFNGNFLCTCYNFSWLMNCTDYGYPNVIPSAGETLATGWFVRWFGGKVLDAAAKVNQIS
jgi:hypothetical protein